MNKKLFSISHCFTLAFFAVVGCSGSGKPKANTLDNFEGLQASVSLTQIPPVAKISNSVRMTHKPVVQLDPIVDKRSRQIVLRYGENDIVSRGDVTRVVRYQLRRALQRQGFSIDKNAAAVLRGAISQWKATLEENTFSGEAVLLAEVVGPGERVLYSSIYEGFADVASPELLQNDLEKALGLAMRDALTNLLQDEQLIEFLSSY